MSNNERAANMVRGAFNGDPYMLAEAFAASGLFPDVKKVSQAVVKMIAGQTLGLDPLTAMSGIHVIDGKPVLGATLMASKVKSSKRYDYRITEHTAEICTIAFYQDDELIGESTFTIEDAKAADLLGPKKANWRRYPKTMLFHRALSQGVRWYCPDVLGGSFVHTPDELGAEVDDNGMLAALPAPAEGAENDLSPIAELNAGNPSGPAPTEDELAELGDRLKKCGAEPDEVAQMLGYVLGTDPGDVSDDDLLNRVVSSLDSDQAQQVNDWIARRERKLEAEAGK